MVNTVNQNQYARDNFCDLLLKNALNMSNIKELGDQQIKHQIYLKFYSYRLLFSKRKVPIYTYVFKFKYLPTFLYRALLLKETKIV